MGMTSTGIRSRALDGRNETRRALIIGGLSAEDANAWCAAWEAEAERQGVRADNQYFWDAGRGWIDAQRAPVVPGPDRPDRGRQAGRSLAFSVIRS
jgi:hypothetical protein